MNNGGYFAVGFVIGSAIVQAIFWVLQMCCYIFLNIAILFWEGSKKLFSLFKIGGKKLYSSFKNRKTKS